MKLQSIYRYFATIQPLIRLLWQASPSFFVTSCGLTLLSGLIPIANIYIASILLQNLVQATQLHGPSLLSTKFIVILILAAGSNLLTQIMQRMNATIQGLQRTRVTNHVQLLIAKKASEIDLSYFEDPEFHNRMRIAANEASYRIPMFLDRLMISGSSLATLISLIVIVLFWHAWIVPTILLTSLAMFWISTRFGTMRVNIATKRSETERKKFYLNTLLTSDQAAKEIRVFGLQNYLLTTFRNLLEAIYKQDRDLAIRELFYSGGAAVLLALVQPALFAFTAFQTLQGAISIGQFSLYSQSIIQLESVGTQLIVLQSGLHENNLFAAKLFDFLAVQPKVEAARADTADTKMEPLVGSHVPQIEFSNVSFHYPGTDRAVLKNINFTIQPGKALALVGENGAGKTTLIKLLAGLYEPTEGHILLDGVDIQMFDRNKLRAFLSIIFQDYTIYHFSAQENIGIGQVEWVNDFKRIENAAQQSGLDSVITKLPDGYETVLGRFWQKGHELSGGQRQLVALSRALLRAAPILILDEPSASLDIYAEQHFFQQLLENRVMGSLQTVIFISHRLNTVRRADHILVLANGQLIEQGTHEELIILNGSYAEMFTMQAAPYTGPQASKQGMNVTPGS